MKKLDLTDDEIRELLADNGRWEEGRLHVAFHRLYLDVVCPSDCEKLKEPNKWFDFDFMYCEEGCPYGDVCYEYKGSCHKFGTKSMCGLID